MKALNLKNMKETLVNYSGNREEFSVIWNKFYDLVCLGFISRGTWYKFAKQCSGWYYDEYSDCIRDERNCQDGADCIVWKYTPDAEYHA
jgi:hypothetical protein